MDFSTSSKGNVRAERSGVENLLPLLFGVVALTACATLRPQKSDVAPVELSPEADSYHLYMRARRELLNGDTSSAFRHYQEALRLEPDSTAIWAEYGQAAARQGDLIEAEKAYRRTSELAPKDIEPHLMLAQIYTVTGRWEAAIGEYEKVRGLDPAYPGIDLLIASADIEGGRLDEAEKKVQELLASQPENPSVLFYAARLAALRKDAAGAEALLNRALERAPDSVDLHWERHRLYEETQRRPQAVEELQKILLLSPSHEGARSKLWKWIWATREWSKAESVLLTLASAYPDEPYFFLALGWVFFEDDKRAPAVDAFRRCLELAPGLDDALYGAGVALEAIQKPGEAAAFLEKVGPESELFPEAMVRLSFLEGRQKQWDRAERRLKGLIRGHPQEARFHEGLGLIYQDQRNFGASQKALEKAVELEPDSESILYELGIVQEQNGRREASIETMKRILAGNPRHPNALNWVGYSYAEEGRNLDEAESLVRRALEARPNDGYFMDSLGWVYFQKGDFEGALELLKKAVQITPDDPVINEHLGDTHWNLGELSVAVEFYKKALTLSPKEDQTQRLRRKIEPRGVRL
ncbi:MAG: tetratricopeptide repeat protein [Nitrospirae bacterium]|nr:tetratricopeptide repeat protein [Nitrospirota bacterium]